MSGKNGNMGVKKDMTDKLLETFRSYTHAVQSRFQRRDEEVRERGPLRLFVNEAITLRSLVDELENQPEFHRLVTDTRSAFPEEAYWVNKTAIQNFLRRSGYYLDIFDGRDLNVDATFQNYCEAFEKRWEEIGYFAPMELVRFADEFMDFGSFQIRRFSAEELDTILQNRIREIFYPGAVLDVEELKDYWFICLKTREQREDFSTESSYEPEPGAVFISTRGHYYFGIKYSEYPKPVQSVLQQLALFEWSPDLRIYIDLRTRPVSEGPEKYKGLEKSLEAPWLGFNIPFVLKVSNSLLDGLHGAPKVDLLKRTLSDPETGEGVERPWFLIPLDKNETDQFRAFVQRIVNLFTSLRIKENNWEFLEVALGYFIKAFFSGGLEQLFYHLIVLEALLGETGEGVTERLAGRIASILGENKKKREFIRRHFKKLYRIRCDLVHGRPFKEKIYDGYLHFGRELARATLVWFLHYLNNIQDTIPAGQANERVPSRDEILKALDLDRGSRVRLGQIIGNVPEEFPYVHDWLV